MSGHFRDTGCKPPPVFRSKSAIGCRRRLYAGAWAPLSRRILTANLTATGLDKGGMKGTRAEMGTRDLARFGPRRTRFNRTFTSVTRVQIPSGTPRLFASSRRLTATFDSHGIRDKENGVMEVVVAGDGEQDRGDRRGSSQPDAASKSVRSANAKGGLFIWAFVSAARRY